MRQDYSPFFRTTVGFDRLLNLLETASDGGSGYPPYNIERSDENHYRVTVAVAGFAEKDLSVEVKDAVLTVTGNREGEGTRPNGKPAYLHQGIAGRAFERQFQLAEYVEVTGAGLENDLLHIALERRVPEEKKPRRIPHRRRNRQWLQDHRRREGRLKAFTPFASPARSPSRAGDCLSSIGPA